MGKRPPFCIHSVNVQYNISTNKAADNHFPEETHLCFDEAKKKHPLIEALTASVAIERSGDDTEKL